MTVAIDISFPNNAAGMIVKIQIKNTVDSDFFFFYD